MIPEGFLDVKTNEPPLWEDVIFALEDGRRVTGYFSGKMHGKDEYMDANDKKLSGVIAWKRTYEI